MQRTFIESREFTEWVRNFLSDDGLAGMQQGLLNDPNAGDVMAGCGGLRKLRTPDPKRRKGKRGGARVIYLHVPEAGVIYLLDIYGKDEKDDLSVKEKKILTELAQQLKLEAIHRANRDRTKSGSTK